MTANGKNLYQKLAAIGQEVGAIRVTGKTQHGQPAMSIQDVEEALGGLFVKHGIVSGYSWNAPPSLMADPKQTLWLADLTIWIRNADNLEEHREDRTCDVGSSPSAAVSFSLKRYFRALFHLADEDDETRSTNRPRERKVEIRGATSEASPPPRAPSTTQIPPMIASRDALLMQVTILAKHKYGETWRADVQKLAKSLIAREFKLVADLSVEELEQVVSELEQAP